MLSKKAQYAFRALAVMVEKSSTQFREHAGGALPSETKPISIRDIVETQPMSVKFLESIFLELRRAGVLDSKKGKGGGYFLRRHPEDIPLAQVIRILDGPIAQLPCVSLNFYQKCEGCNEQQCGLHHIMAEVRDANLAVLEKRTLWDLVREQD